MSQLKKLLKKADICKDKISAAQPLAKEDQESLDNYFRVAFTYSSNAMEGNALSISETKILLEDGIITDGNNIKDCYEAIGHGLAYDYMLKSARQKNLTITEEMIKKLNFLVCQKNESGSAAQYRTLPYQTSDASFRFAAPQDIPQLMSHLADQLRASAHSLHPIELAAMAQRRLIDIHPFVQGNGQTARLLMNLILVNSGYGVVCIPSVLFPDYYNALSSSRRLDNLDPFSELIAKCVIEAVEDYCKKMEL